MMERKTALTEEKERGKGIEPETLRRATKTRVFIVERLAELLASSSLFLRSLISTTPINTFLHDPATLLVIIVIIIS